MKFIFSRSYSYTIYDMPDVGSWMTSSQMMRDHPLIGTIVWFNEDPNVSTLRSVINELRSIHGSSGLKAVVTGVIVQSGQTAGYEVRAIDGNTHIGHVRDFYKKSQIGDAHPVQEDKTVVHSAVATRVGDIMRHWKEPKEYYGPYWSGIEKIYARLAPIASMAAIESSGDSAHNWRMILPVTKNPVEVDFRVGNGGDGGDGHTWSIVTTVRDVPLESLDADDVYLLGHPDPWKRSMIWAMRTTEVLEDRQRGIDYRHNRQDMITRMGIATLLHEMKVPLLAQLHEQYERLFGLASYAAPEYITIAVTEWDLPSGKESFYMPPHYDVDSGWIFWGTIVIHPKLAKNTSRARDALIHQLVHAMFNTSCERGCHKKITNDMKTLIRAMSTQGR